MAIPVLHHLSSPDLERGRLPPDPASCAIAMDAEIGPAADGGAERFSFLVVTPDCALTGGGSRWGRGSLIVDHFSWELVERALSKLLLHADRASWKESARELAKELHWEFEGYSEALRR